MRLTALPFVFALVACTPAHDWRETRLVDLTALLPCKPDRAQRSVRIGAFEVVMDMTGCEAANTLFAVSHVRVQDRSQVSAVLSAWRTATLANLRAKSVQVHPFKLSKSADGAYQVPMSKTGAAVPTANWEMLWAEGQRADASEVHARLAWFARGADVYHVAVYGARLNQDAVDMIFSDLRLQ